MREVTAERMRRAGAQMPTHFFEHDDTGATFYIKVRGAPEQAIPSIRRLVRQAVVAPRGRSFDRTVETYVTNILSKLGANDRSHAVTIALKRGIIELEVPQSSTQKPYS